MPGTTILLSSKSDAGIVDLCRKVDAKIKHPWKFLQMPFGWLLVVFFDSGVDDHPLRDAGENEGGKCELKWYERKHEVIGIGATPNQAAHAILADGKGARLRGMQVCYVGSTKRHLAFKHLDSGQVYWPCPGGVFLPRSC